jgi:tetratricopeptide (TPR) repeat protein
MVLAAFWLVWLFSAASAISDGALAKEASAEGKVISLSDDGLAPSVRLLVNRGKWTESTSKLEELAANNITAGRNHAWLAFAYLHTGKRDKLQALSVKVQSMPASDDDPHARAIVAALAQAAEGSFAQAEKTLSQLKPGNKDDLLLDLSRSCLALNKKKPAEAIQFCQKAVDIRPDFAWGYRTLGFIQQESLMNDELAERAYEKALSLEPDFEEARNSLINLRLARNDFDGAIKILQEGLRLFGSDANFHFRLAMIYKEQWRSGEALAELEKALLNKRDPRFFRAMAAIYRSQNRISEAMTAQRQAVELESNKTSDLIELALLQEENHDLPLAIDSLRAALKETPANRDARQRLVALLKKAGRRDELIAELKHAVEIDPKFEPWHQDLAEAYRLSGRAAEAIAELKEASRLNPRDVRLYRDIAKGELNRQDFQAAALDCARALNTSLNSGGPGAGPLDDLLLLGSCYAENSDYPKAESAYYTAYELLQLCASTGMQNRIKPADVLRSYASVLLTEGRFGDCAANMEKGVIPYDPDNEQKRLDQFMYSIARALRDRNSESTGELQSRFSALDQADQMSNLDAYAGTLMYLDRKDMLITAVMKFPEPVLKEECPLALSTAWLAQDRLSEARALLTRAIEKYSLEPAKVAQSCVLLARVMLRESDSKSAVAALQKAIEINPRDSHALVDLGKIFLSENKTGEARQTAERVLELNAFCVPAYLLLADTYMALNKFTEAESNYGKAVELYPALVDAHKGLLSVLQKESKTDEARKEQEIISRLLQGN